MHLQGNTGSPLVLIHETSPDIALSILRGRKFIAGPILGDAGINCYIEGVDSYHPDQAASKGAFLTFEWSGPVEASRSISRHEPEVLYDERPHRAFVFTCTKKHLRVTGLSFREGHSFDGLVGQAPWYVLNKPRWAEQAHAQIQTEVDRILREKPVISVVPPPDAPYLFILRERNLI
ncbi:hypothetical protein [Burkholderia sp. Ac-20365]|uniref:hypothetical protein n=1 Tax=Burkholderia sp. Ac-20365 TaxID=2703897 RepID=UPI00197BEACC|nr:hypothetical protein [Burkholderia sp. Ac-20365]MBN3761328.1 hypothetical protein [Burkholderia sp. Ac-20365]